MRAREIKMERGRESWTNPREESRTVFGSRSVRSGVFASNFAHRDARDIPNIYTYIFVRGTTKTRKRRIPREREREN